MTRKMIFIIGPPGAGKTLLAEKLAEEFNLYHLSVGTYLRSKHFPPLYSRPRVMKHPDLLPCPLVNTDVLNKIMAKQHEGHEKFLIEGFPRSVSQIKAFERQFDMPDILISVSCSKEMAKERDSAQEISNTLLMKSPFEQRYKTFKEYSPAIIDCYRAADRLIQIDTSEDIEEAYGDLLFKLCEYSVF
ncbi:hypothetical protein AJ80_09220 [Polytolypa hystricis UAMH7299]|uniref:Adenylate kinase n=1 Tax=Polytolypa hystricis (strain UAMH7299) TaxID=1447883 RepID=A0A2B7WUF2_POLH7|nr:hypothetical protein AJ80_09220 [Polytolypa hystricis UAMH7299]